MNFEKKAKLLLLAFLLVYLGIWARLFYWQVLKADQLSAAAEAQHFYSLTIPARRGEIRFVDSSPLVSNKAAYLLYSNVTEIKLPKEELASKLGAELAKDVALVSTDGGRTQKQPEQVEEMRENIKKELVQQLTDRLNLERVVWVNLANFVSRETRASIEKLKFSGIYFADEETRDYPEASMAAHLVGFVGSDQRGNPKGYFGLEGYYERELAGKAGEIRVEKDAFGRPIAIGSEERKEKQNGRDLLTSIDRSVQFFVEEELLKGISQWQATGGTAIVMNPNNGEIVALANFPSYEPYNFSLYPPNIYKNPAIADLYEPGSIMKPLVMASAINEGKVTPETHCPRCAGPVPVGGFLIHTFNNQYHPSLTMTDVLVNSDNTGMVYVGEALGFEKLYQYVQKFGFGEKTGVDLEEEEEGELRPAKDHYPIDRATLTFGQGIGVNALQMVRAFATLANGGKLVTPHIVKKIISENKKIDVNWPLGESVISEETSKIISEILVRVTNESPIRFPKERVPELKKYRIAAKSGTAQIAVGGKYKEKGTIGSVIGYFPAERPRFLVYVKLNEPAVRPWGSDTAGPVFFGIIKNLVNYYGISP